MCLKLHNKVALLFVSSGMGRLSKLAEPMGSIDHFCVPNWRRIFIRFCKFHFNEFCRDPPSTNLSFSPRGSDSQGADHSVIFCLDPIDWEKIHKRQRNGETCREKSTQAVEKSVILKFWVRLRTLCNFYSKLVPRRWREVSTFWPPPLFLPIPIAYLTPKKMKLIQPEA